MLMSRCPIIARFEGFVFGRLGRCIHQKPSQAGENVCLYSAMFETIDLVVFSQLSELRHAYSKLKFHMVPLGDPAPPLSRPDVQLRQLLVDDLFRLIAPDAFFLRGIDHGVRISRAGHTVKSGRARTG